MGWLLLLGHVASLQRLNELKVHPRETQPNIFLLNRLGRLYEEHLGDERAMYGDMLSEFELLLEEQDLKKIERRRLELETALERFEREDLW